MTGAICKGQIKPGGVFGSSSRAADLRGSPHAQGPGEPSPVECPLAPVSRVRDEFVAGYGSTRSSWNLQVLLDHPSGKQEFGRVCDSWGTHTGNRGADHLSPPLADVVGIV